MAYTGSIPDTLARPRPWAWQEQAGCRTEDLDLFFEQRYEHMARTVCVARCPVRAKCLTAILAVERGMGRDCRYGIFAGLDGRERWHLDPTAPGHGEDGSSVLRLDGPSPECGSYEALVRHLARGERVDPTCWSGEVRRAHGNKSRPRNVSLEPEPEALTQAPPEPAPAPVEPAPAPVRPIPQDGRRKPARRGDTPHERRIYILWSTGASDLDIARRMAVSVPSVKRVRDKLGLLPNSHARAS